MSKQQRKMLNVLALAGTRGTMLYEQTRQFPNGWSCSAIAAVDQLQDMGLVEFCSDSALKGFCGWRLTVAGIVRWTKGGTNA